MKLRKSKITVVRLPDEDDEAEPVLVKPKAGFKLFRPKPKPRKQSFFRPVSELPVVIPWSELDQEEMYVLPTYSVVLGSKFKAFEGYEIANASPERLGVSVEVIAPDVIEAREEQYRGSNNILLSLGKDRYVHCQEVDRTKYPGRTAAWINLNLFRWGI